MDLYIYYKVESRDAPVWQVKVAAMQAALQYESTVKASLKRRPDVTNELHTWMEIYIDTPTGFEATLDMAIAKAGLNSMIVGKRHTEHFLDCSSCA